MPPTLACHPRKHATPAIHTNGTQFLKLGTNDLTTDRTLDEIFSEILRLIKELKTDKNKIVVSTIVPRGYAYNTKAEKVNT